MQKLSEPGENLTLSERALSIVGAIPFGNYFKLGKPLKNAQQFQKASQRAKQAGILKNAVNYGKAAVRQMAKSEIPQKVIKGVAKGVKNVLKIFSNNNEDNN